MSEDLHLTTRDLARLRQALEATEPDDAPVTPEEEAAAGLDTPEGQARLERLWQAFLSAAAAAAAGQSGELAMSNENVPVKRDLVAGLEYNRIPDAWVGDADERQNVDLKSLLNPIPQLAMDLQERQNDAPGQILERVTLADGRVVTRPRTPEE
jgi:hypothetical protein